MARANADSWQYSRWISNIGRSLRINPASASEKNAVEIFIQRMVNPTTGTRPWLADSIRLVCNALVSGTEPISPAQPNIVEAKIVVIIGRDLMKIPMTTIEKPYCDELIGATGERKYRNDNSNEGVIYAEWYDNFELGNFSKWTTATGSPIIIADPDNVTNNLASLEAGDSLFKDWGSEFQLNHYGRVTVIPGATVNHEFKLTARNSIVAAEVVLKDGIFYRVEGVSPTLIPFTNPMTYVAGETYIIEINSKALGIYEILVNGVSKGTFAPKYIGTLESSFKFSAITGNTKVDEAFVYQSS